MAAADFSSRRAWIEMASSLDVAITFVMGRLDGDVSTKCRRVICPPTTFHTGSCKMYFSSW